MSTSALETFLINIVPSIVVKNGDNFVENVDKRDIGLFYRYVFGRRTQSWQTRTPSHRSAHAHTTFSKKHPDRVYTSLSVALIWNGLYCNWCLVWGIQLGECKCTGAQGASFFVLLHRVFMEWVIQPSGKCSIRRQTESVPTCWAPAQTQTLDATLRWDYR